MVAILAAIAAAVLAWRLRTVQSEAQQDRMTAANTLHELRQQLAQAVLLHESILKAVDDVLIVADGQQKILLVNQAAIQLLGRNPTGNTLIAALRHSELEALLADAEKLHGESVERRIEHEKRIFQARAVNIQSESHTLNILILRDVTELQRLERARREMVSNITHELGTPITNIGLLTETILSTPIKHKFKPAYKLIKDIRREVDTLTLLVQEIRDLSLIESGQMPVRLLPIDLWDVVEESTTQLAPLAESRHQTITNTVEPGTIVLADNLTLQRAIKNIVHNALKFSDEHGQVTISASKTDDEVILAIKDNGPGIPADELPRIFERFYQVDRARRQGTGLGLAIVRHIALAHGGRTWAESTPGEGATFFIALVAAQPESVEEP